MGNGRKSNTEINYFKCLVAVLKRELWRYTMLEHPINSEHAPEVIANLNACIEDLIIHFDSRCGASRPLALNRSNIEAMFRSYADEDADD